MKVVKNLLPIIFCLALSPVEAQVKSFELTNAEAIPLDSENLKILTSSYWRVFTDEVDIREKNVSTKKNISVCYYPDGKFFYNGSMGTWKVLEDKYIEHQLESPEVANRLNFGGIFSITDMNSTNLTLTKVLTSTHDMKRTLRLKSSTVLTTTEQPNAIGPYFYNEKLSESAIDSLRNMNAEELFNNGFNVMRTGSIHVLTPDSLYVIKLQTYQ